MEVLERPKFNKSGFSPRSSQKLKRLLPFMLIVVIAGAGVYLLAKSMAGPLPVGPTCGKRVANYTYQRPFGDNAAWNVPACAVDKWTSRSDDWVNRLWNHASKYSDGSKWQVEFGLIDSSVAGNDYSIPVYDAAEKTYDASVRPKASYEGSIDIGPDGIQHNADDWTARIPFNHKWRPSDGNDATMVILDRKANTELFLWNAAWGGFTTPANNITECATDLNNFNDKSWLFYNGRGTNYSPDRDICAAAAIYTRGPDKKIADIRTYEGNSPAASGGGLQNYAGLTMPEEVEAGEIRHALKFMITNTMFGPTCPVSMSIDDPAFGTTCGSAVAPAGKFEGEGRVSGIDENTKSTGHGSGTQLGNTPDERRANTVPEGMRFALDIDDSYIENWLTSRGYTGRKRQTAKIFAQAIRDYGIIVTDTTAGGATIQVAGGTNPETAKKWRDLGIDNNGKDLLYGLFAKDKLYAIQPAVNTCANNVTSRYYCHASKTGYSNVSTTPTQSVNQAPQISIQNPTNGQNFDNSASLTAQVNAQDDGYITKVEYFNNGKLVGSSTASPLFTVSLSGIGSGTHTITAKATDNQNLQTTSAPVKITVKRAAETVAPSPPIPDPGDNSNGPGSLGNPVPPPSSPPKAPTNINGYIAFNALRWHYGINLSWTEASPSSNIKEYVLKRNGKEIMRSNARVYTDYDIVNGAKYSYEVVAQDKQGYYSQPKGFTTTTVCSWIFCTLR